MAFLKLFFVFVISLPYYPIFSHLKGFHEKKKDFKQHKPIIPANRDAEEGGLQFKAFLTIESVQGWNG